MPGEAALRVPLHLPLRVRGAHLVDGILVHDFESENRAQWDKGDVTVEVLPFAPSPAPERVVEVVLPWCASITFRGIELHSEASAPAPRVCADTPPPRRVYAAIGDSITHGWCGNVTYPTELAAPPSAR